MAVISAVENTSAVLLQPQELVIRFNAAGEFVEIEKLVRPAEGVKALGNAMAALIGPPK
jgi:hypothetical protein